MNDHEPDDAFDAMLKAHLSRELDPHVGSTMTKFDALRHDVTTPRMRIGLLQAVGGPFRWSAAAMVLIGLGIASSFIARTARGPAVKPDAPIVAVVPPRNEPTDAIVTSWTETYDGGTVLVDPRTPARMLRRVQYEETKWKDGQGQWQSKITTPQQDVILVDLVKQ